MRANLIISCISIPLLYWLVHTLLFWPQLCTCHPPCLSLSWCLSLRCLLSSNVSKCQAKRWELYKKKRRERAIKMESSRSCWVRPSDKKGLWASQAVFTPPPSVPAPAPFSLVHSLVTLNSGLTFSRGQPWLAVKRSEINMWVEERV